MAGEERDLILKIDNVRKVYNTRNGEMVALNGVDLDIYENESIAIFGESGSGKSVFTKTFEGMLDENGFIEHGEIIFRDDELADTSAGYGFMLRQLILVGKSKLDNY